MDKEQAGDGVRAGASPPGPSMSGLHAPEGGEAPPPVHKYTVFLSYCHKDLAMAHKIVTALRHEHIEVWWDELLSAGSSFSSTIELALRKADAVMVLWSHQSVDSTWVRDEAQIGRDRGRLVPVSIQGATPPLGFGQYHATDFSHWNGSPRHAEFQTVMQRIHALAEGTETPEPPVQLAPDRRRLMLGAGAALLLVAAGGVATWRYLGGGEGASAIRKVAVLPLANRGGPDQAYFSDGLTDDLRSVLAQNPQLKVAAPASSDMFRASKEQVQKIAGRLGVDLLVSGSVRREAGMVRVVVQIVDGANGFMTWSRTFDRPMRQIFPLQDEIAATVSRALADPAAAAGAGDRPIERRGGTTNVAAYDAWLKGVALYNLASNDATDQAALAAFAQAIALDPGYAAAWASKARTLTAIANGSGSGVRMKALYDEAIATARKAVAIAPDFADGQAALGYALLNGHLDIAGAAGPYRRSIDLAGNDADMLVGFATFATRTGDFAAARSAIEKAVRLDPLNASAFRVYGNLEFAQRNYPLALQRYDQALARNPGMRGTHAAIGDAQLMQGALEAADAAYRLEPGRLFALRGEAIVAARRGAAARAGALLATMVREFGANSLYQQAEILAQQGQVAAALDRLDQARTAGDSGVILARNDPLLDPLRKEPRFAALLARIGFVPT